MTGRHTRREALALLGSVALAGCSSDLLSSDSPDLDAAALREAVAADLPPYPERLPVAVAPGHLDAARARARRFLGSVPPRFEPSHVPNGAIRERMQHARDHAATSLANASEAGSAFERLDALAGARADARYVAAAWRAVDEDLAREDLADEAAAVRRSLADLRDRWSYVGGDPAEATVIHAAVERRVDARTLSVDGRGRYRAGNPLGVGEVAEEVERARTDHEDAAHVYDRWLETLDDATDLEPKLTAVDGHLRATLRSDLPSGAEVDPERPWAGLGSDVEETPAERVLDELYDPLDPRRADLTDPPDEGRLAQSILGMHGTAAHLRAFQRTRDRVADGERFSVSSADDVAALRAEALDALRTAADETVVPVVTQRLLSSLADRLRYADERLSEFDRSVSVERVEHSIVPYVVVAALARATPAASERVATAFRRA